MRSRGHRRRPRGSIPQPDEPPMTQPATAPFLTMLLAQTRSELLMRWRVPAFSVTNLALPIVFFTFFGLPVAHVVRRDGVSIGAYLLASFGAPDADRVHGATSGHDHCRSCAGLLVTGCLVSGPTSRSNKLPQILQTAWAWSSRTAWRGPAASANARPRC